MRTSMRGTDSAAVGCTIAESTTNVPVPEARSKVVGTVNVNTVLALDEVNVKDDG